MKCGLVEMWCLIVGIRGNTFWVKFKYERGLGQMWSGSNVVRVKCDLGEVLQGEVLQGQMLQGQMLRGQM